MTAMGDPPAPELEVAQAATVDPRGNPMGESGFPGVNDPTPDGRPVADRPPAMDLPPVTALPDPVRLRIVEWAADTLGGLPPVDIPPSLARVARFAPNKRAKVAATALGQAVSTNAAFRAQVAERAVLPLPDPDPGRSDRQSDHDADELARLTARAYLLRLPELDDLLAQVTDRHRHRNTQSRTNALERQVQRLTAALERSRAELATLRAAPAAPGADPDVERLRQRLREQGSRMREMQESLDGLRGDAAAAVGRAQAERDRALADTEVWRQRAQAATAKAEAANQSLQRLRDSAGDRKAISDRRVELLLGALEGAASGLRREWDLVGGGSAPADVVAARLPAMTAAGERTADPARLLAWVGLPGAHLIVDGYNVSKTGFADLSLSDQRDRLIRLLAALAARTSAEVTVVFDGAAVAAARPPGRGIRVLFSAAGVLADDVIKDLVRAEPRGRVVIVVSSDRQVADTASRDGARTAASAVFLAALGGRSPVSE